MAPPVGARRAGIVLAAAWRFACTKTLLFLEGSVITRVACSMDVAILIASPAAAECVNINTVVRGTPANHPHRS
jgi:hypothetical protein